MRKMKIEVFGAFFSNKKLESEKFLEVLYFQTSEKIF